MDTLESPTAYEILDLPVNATEDEIRKRSRELSFRYHPDQNGGSDAYKRQFDAVQEARRELLDPERRSALQKRILFAAWLRFKADYDAPSTLQMTTKAPVSFDDFTRVATRFVDQQPNINIGQTAAVLSAGAAFDFLVALAFFK